MIVKARVEKGKIVPHGEIPWPEGCELEIAETRPDVEKLSVDESEWRDDQEAIAEFERVVNSLEHFEFTEEEVASNEAFQRQMYDLEMKVVRRMMGLDEPS